MQGYLYLAVIFVWIVIYFCVFKGVRSSSIVVWVSVPLPLVLIFILMMRGVSLPGAGDGIKLYLGGEDGADHAAILSKPEIWADACA